MGVGAATVATSGREVRAARWIAWVAWLAGNVLRVVQLANGARIATEGLPVAWGVTDQAIGAATIFGFLQATVGAVIVGRRPRNVIGWILVGSGLVQGLLGAASSWSSLALARAHEEPAILVSTLASIGIQAVPLAVITIVLLIFPDGRFLSPRWRWVVVLASAGFALRAAEVTWGPIDNFLIPEVSNTYRAPFGLQDAVSWLYGWGLGYRVLQTAVTLASISLWLRYRRADRVTRLQLRWFFFSAVALGVMALPFAYVNLAVPRTDRTVEWAVTLLFLGFALPSIAIFFAITRYRLYEIDRIVNRAVLYATLTAVLAGLFTAGIGLAQRAFVLATGERSDAALVLTTFVVATAYAPLRKWLEGVVDRNFKYEHERFGAFRDEVTRVLAIVDPARAGARLCREAVDELDAIGAALVDDAERPIAHAGTWPVPPAVRIPISAAGRSFRGLLVGPRRDGQPHDPAVVAELEDLASLVGVAIGFHAPVADRTGEVMTG